MFKKPLLILSLMTLSGAALSAPPTAHLKVTGAITPPTCMINGQEEDTLIYIFNISPGIFPATGTLGLDEQSQNIEVVCNATTYLTFTSTDERAGTEFAAGTNFFGLGYYGTDTKIGYYQVIMRNATVKADADAIARSVNILTGTTYSTAIFVDKFQVLGWATSNTQLAVGQIFTADLAVRPRINNVMKSNTDNAQLDGLAILIFAFGL